MAPIYLTAAEFGSVLNLENSENDYHRLEMQVSDVATNFTANVQLAFLKQYVRAIRLHRKSSPRVRPTRGRVLMNWRARCISTRSGRFSCYSIASS